MSINGPLKQVKKYTDGRTKQAFRDECDINLIMARAAKGGTISHLEQFEGVYADFSDFDFHEHTNKLTKGREVFDALPAEVRREFGQSPAKFFAYVNDPANINDLAEKLPGLAAPGDQLIQPTPPNADEETALAVTSELASAKNKLEGEATAALGKVLTDALEALKVPPDEESSE